MALRRRLQAQHSSASRHSADKPSQLREQALDKLLTLREVRGAEVNGEGSCNFACLVG